MIIGVEQFMVSPLRRRYKNILTFDRISVVINNANLLIFEDKLYIYIYIYIYMSLRLNATMSIVSHLHISDVINVCMKRYIFCGILCA